MAVSYYFGLVTVVSVLSLCIAQIPFDEHVPEALGGDPRNVVFFPERGRDINVDNVPMMVSSPMPKPEATGSCGGSFTGDKGTIASPGYPTDFYPSSANCSWDITVPSGKVILMEFKYMDVEVGPPECPFDGVLVVDYLGLWNFDISQHFHGPVVQGVRDPQAPPASLGRYCGGELFTPFMSITNSVRIGFYSDDDSEATGFVMHWKAVDIENGTSNVIESCDFANGLCPGWQNVQTEEDTFDWNITNGQTKTDNTGPSFDHTKNNTDGKYAFIEASKPQIMNDTALLSSPEITFESGQTELCVDFWYHMYGEAIGSLVVGLAVGEERGIEWMKFGDQGKKWMRAAISISRIEQPFHVLFAGVRGNGYAADIALDDIRIFGKPCDEIKWTESQEINNLERPDANNENVDSPCENSDDYPCMGEGITKCISDDQMCDGKPDCPQEDDESEFFCILDATTAVPPPPFTAEDTTYYAFESTVVMETTEDITVTDDLSTFVLETTEISSTTKTDTTPQATTISTSTTEATTTSDEETTSYAAEVTEIATTQLKETTATNKEFPDTTEVDIGYETTTEEMSTPRPHIVHASTMEEISTIEMMIARNTPRATTLPTEPSTEKVATTAEPSTEKVATTALTKASSTSPPSSTMKSSTLEIASSSRTSSSPPEIEVKTKFPASTSAVKKTEVPRMTAVANVPTMAEKQTGDDGSFAVKLSSQSVVFLCLIGAILQWFTNRL